MIKNIIKIAFFCIVVCLLGACVDNTFIDGTDEPRVEEGIPMTVDLSFQVEKTAVQTRAAASVNAENKVLNIYVFAFNSDGTLDNKRFYQDGDLDWEKTNEKDSENDSPTTGTIKNFAIHSGNEKTFYAVANVGYSGLEKQTLDDVSNKEALLGLTFTLSQAANIQRTYFVMTGQLGYDSDQDGVVDKFAYNVSAGDNELFGKLYFKRTDARITFNVTARNDNGYDNFSFVPKNYRVFNISRSSYLFEQENDASGEYNDLPSALSFDVANNGAEVIRTFDFYVQENRLEPIKRITVASKNGYEENVEATLFSMREKREKSDDLSARTFVFAPQNGTYVEIKGQLSYQKTDDSDNTEFISADVTYTIHLGNTGGVSDVNDETKVNNYDTERNTHYTYNVTITDINSIIVEVEDDKETRPGAEGDVVIAGGEVLELDSHFDRYLFYLYLDDLKDQTPDGRLTWAVSTPFENAMRITGPNGNMPHDYKWITFAVNWEYGADKDHYVKYPGDFAYDGYNGVEPTTTGTYVNPAWTGYRIPEVNAGKIVLRDIEQLLNYLTAIANSNPDHKMFVDVNGKKAVAVTAFIDEFVYVTDPVDPSSVGGGTPTNPTDAGLLLWKKVVNGRDRLLHICRGEGVKSDDGASSVIRSVLSFKQHPIYTLYDVDSDVTTAWGTESVMETDELNASFDHPHKDMEPYTNTPDNGRQNQMNFVVDVQKNWTDIISTSSRYGLNSSGGSNSIDYNTIWHACMLRNRDVNGDNVVDGREVRWYLAAIDQLSDLWTGDAAINESARTYPQEQYGKRYHLASSTYWDNTAKSENPTVMWAEEGGSIGDFNYSSGRNTEKVVYNPTEDNYAYRCVRNLGIRLDESDKTPDDYIDWDASDRIVDMSRLGYAAKRTAYDGGNNLDEHNERDVLNRPYTKFQVDASQSYYKDDRGVIEYLSWNAIHNRLYPTWGRSESPCPAGYRLPNQREVGIMLTIPALKSEMSSTRTITNTAFSMNGTGILYSAGNRPGFLYDGTEGTFILDTDPNDDGSDTGRVGGTRCVRDVR